MVSRLPDESGWGISVDDIPVFDRDLFGSAEKFTRIGAGRIGGKATGLAFIKDKLAAQLDLTGCDGIYTDIPALTVVATSVFDSFMKRNDLYPVVLQNMPDDRIALAFQKAEFPVEMVGDLRGLIEKVHTPLAVRSSSLLEDALFRPFAGVYGTKMIPNNQPDADTRFRRLIEAIKFVYASTFFKEARDYITATGQSAEDEKMAVIIQEVVGDRHGDRFYPDIAGVARSYNYYPFGRAKPEEGIVALALGLGKTIVDGGKAWAFCPEYPAIGPPYGSVAETLKQTQTEFWAVNMGRPPEHDPIRETEYLVLADLEKAEYDGTLELVASTYLAGSDRVVMGTASPGPRILDFAPCLRLKEFPLNEPIKRVLRLCEKATGEMAEIEFAIELKSGPDKLIRFALLQVRPMVVAEGDCTVAESELSQENVLIASTAAMGNARIDNIRDVVYVRPDTFQAGETRRIAREIDSVNQSLVAARKPYLLIGFGRWGSTDPWLGIPVNWSQMSGATVIVEATLPDMNVDPSQGSHFFHNMTSFQVGYFSVHHDGEYPVAWDWLDRQQVITETKLIRQVRLQTPLRIKIDGKSRRGVILYG